jgi:demethylmenaquinone methyltransferase/2-methoxy-6-polyprenyl-1,4-benzoquinol methylase
VSAAPPAFATDAATASYYDARAGEYDDWYLGRGLFAGRNRPGWDQAVADLVEVVAGLPPAATLDVACGSGFLTRHLRGPVVGLDQSRSMLDLARDRIPGGRVIRGDALSLALADDSFERVFTGHLYGHLPGGERAAFIAEARRVAAELVVVDSARRPGVEAEQTQERVLNDGSVHRVFKRYLTAAQLAGEIGGDVLADGEWFVAAHVSWR